MNLAQHILVSGYRKHAGFVNAGVTPMNKLPKPMTGSMMQSNLPKPPTSSKATSSWAAAPTSPLMSSKPSAMPKIAASITSALAGAAVSNVLNKPEHKDSDKHKERKITSRDPKIQKMLENQRVKAYLNKIIN